MYRIVYTRSNLALYTLLSYVKPLIEIPASTTMNLSVNTPQSPHPLHVSALLVLVFYWWWLNSLTLCVCVFVCLWSWYLSRVPLWGDPGQTPVPPLCLHWQYQVHPPGMVSVVWLCPPVWQLFVVIVTLQLPLILKMQDWIIYCHINRADWNWSLPAHPASTHEKPANTLSKYIIVYEAHK